MGKHWRMFLDENEKAETTCCEVTIRPDGWAHVIDHEADPPVEMMFLASRIRLLDDIGLSEVRDEDLDTEKPEEHACAGCEDSGILFSTRCDACSRAYGDMYRKEIK